MPNNINRNGAPTIPRAPGTGTTPGADTTTSTTGPGASTATTATDAVGATTAHTVSDSFAPGGTGGASGIGGKVKEFVLERTYKELRSGLSLSGSTSTDNTRLGVRLRQRVHTKDDPAVKNDPVRVATTERLSRGGQDVIWAETGGLIKGGPDMSTSIPVSGVLNVNAGFSAQGLIEYRAVVPRQVRAGDISDVFSKDNLQMPLTSGGAQGLEPGTVVELVGKGTARINAGVSAGTGAATSAVHVDASVGLGHARTRTATWGVKVTRLEGTKVRVKLSEIKERKRETNLHASARVRVDTGLIAADLGSTFDPQTADVNNDAITDANLGDKSLKDVVGSTGASALESAVKRFTAFHAQAGVSAREIRHDEVSYVLDLSDPAAAKAYEDLIRLDTDKADTLAKTPGGAVSQHVYQAVTDENRSTARVRFAGEKLILFNALKSETNATTSGPGHTTRLIRTATYSRDYDGIISGDKSILWEGVNVQNAGGGASSNFFHMRFNKDDKVTRNSELKTFVRFADALGVKDADERRIVMPSAPWIGRLFSSDDNTRVDVDIYFTDAGVRNVANSTPDAVRSAFADAMGRLDPDVAGVGVNDMAMMQVAVNYAAAKKDARRNGPRDNSNGARREMSKLSREYKNKTGRDLSDDYAVFVGANAFVGHVSSMGTMGNEAGWASLFSDIGEAEKFDYMPTMVALKNLAGADETLVHDVRLQGENIQLRAVDEGSLSHPEPVRT